MGGDHPDPVIRGEPGLNFFFWPLRPQFCLKIRGGGRASRASSRDPPLLIIGCIFLFTGRWTYNCRGGLKVEGGGVIRDSLRYTINK